MAIGFPRTYSLSLSWCIYGFISIIGSLFILNGGRAISSPLIIPRPEHNISRANISEGALKVLYRLKAEGYEAYLVGGGVRDLLLGREPKDFDVATDAHPEEVRQVFRNCRLIGRRFRLAHVRFGPEIVEVATFRGVREAEDELEYDQQSSNGMLLSDNVYGTIEEDAWRRDFTVNALYYNIRDFSVVDYSGGLADLREGLLRLHGDPEQRFREDPVRMLRAMRFMARLGFRLETETERPIERLAPLLQDVPAARLFDEVLKLFLSATAVSSFEHMRHYGLFGQLFPDTEEALTHEDHQFPLSLVRKGLENTERRIQEGLPVTPAFLFAVLLWEPVRRLAEELQEAGEAPLPAMQQAAGTVVSRLISRVALPRRFSTPMIEIWQLQSRFEQTKGRRPAKLMSHPRFRAAYDFLLLRAAAGEADPQLAQWWTDYQAAEAPERDKLSAGGEPAGSGRRRRRRRRKPKPESSD